MPQDVDEDLDEVLDAVVATSRVLVDIAPRSLVVATKDVTLTECRALVRMTQLRPGSLVALADVPRVDPSTAKRMCDWVIAKSPVTALL